MVKPIAPYICPPDPAAHGVQQRSLRVTFVPRGFPRVFYQGDGGSITGISNLEPRVCFDQLYQLAVDRKTQMNVGLGRLQDQFVLDDLRRNPDTVMTRALKLRLRYRLAVFDISVPATASTRAVPTPVVRHPG